MSCNNTKSCYCDACLNQRRASEDTNKHNLSSHMRYALRCYWKKNKRNDGSYTCFVTIGRDGLAWNTRRALQRRGLVEHGGRLSTEGIRVHLKLQDTQ